MTTHSIKITLILFASAVLITCSSTPPADLILSNGKIYTVNEAQPVAEAIAVRKGKIIAIGTSAEVNSLKGSSTKTIDLTGKLVLPGFIDSHTHAFWGGQRLSEVDVSDAETVEALQERLATWIVEKQIPEGQPVWGVGSFPDTDLFGDVGWPTKEILDAVSPKNPVILTRGGGHAYWLNSLALELSGIRKGMSQPDGGEIIFDDTSGEPTGILKENALELATKAIPHPVKMEEIFVKAMDQAISLGITGITIMPLAAGQKGRAALQRLNAEGKLNLRVYLGYAPIQLDSLIAAKAKSGDGNEMLQTGPIKIFMDGSLGALSAFMYEPFHDDPGNSGIPRYAKEDLNALVNKANANNFQVAIHAIGDQAVTWALDAIENAQEKSGQRNLRHRIEHNTVNTLADAKRFGPLGVVASMQPHITGGQEYRERRLGAERAHRVDMWRTLLEDDAMLAFGTDWPVSSLNPMDIIYDVVTRYSEQRLTMEEAIKYYTYGSAFACREETTRGTLEVGKLADMVVLSQDLLTIPAEEIKNTEVLYTILGGTVVYQK